MGTHSCRVKRVTRGKTSYETINDSRLNVNLSYQISESIHPHGALHEGAFNQKDSSPELVMNP